MNASIVAEIMSEFAGLTGLSPASEFPRRYLWTDAFAVCNFLELFRQTHDEKYKGLALLLVDQVHNRLGRHRDDDSRFGWISGLDEEEGKSHPTKGGLRIGKKLKERSRSDVFDEQLEWDRDGQYYHYLTKWMHALHRVSSVTGDPTYHRWAVDLAKTAHARFVYAPPLGGQKRMYWKMNIDLSSPLVSSMGHHDPLDGFITYSQLQAASATDVEKSTWGDLRTEIIELADICRGKSWTTDDPLGIGGLLSDAFKVAQLLAKGDFKAAGLLGILLDSSLQGLEAYVGASPLKLPPKYRLAFRELGLSIGLRAVERLQGLADRHSDLFNKIHLPDSVVERLMEYTRLSEAIEMFWLKSDHQETDSWKGHREINMVMLATSLAPNGYLRI